MDRYKLREKIIEILKAEGEPLLAREIKEKLGIGNEASEEDIDKVCENFICDGMLKYGTKFVRSNGSVSQEVGYTLANS